MGWRVTITFDEDVAERIRELREGNPTRTLSSIVNELLRIGLGGLDPDESLFLSPKATNIKA